MAGAMVQTWKLMVNTEAVDGFKHLFHTFGIGELCGHGICFHAERADFACNFFTVLKGSGLEN